MLITTALAEDPPELRRSIVQHQEWMQRTQEKENQQAPLFEEAK